MANHEAKVREPVARSHFFCEAAVAKDGTALLRTQFYVEKTDPRMNSCCPTHARCFRSNVDCKACIDKYGVCQYVTKFTNYCSKPETQTANYANLLAMKLATTVPGAAAHAPCRSFLFDVCKRDYSAQEVSAINLKCKSVACSHNFIHCRWNGGSREAEPGPKAGVVSTRLNQREIYLQRADILGHQRHKRVNSKKGMTMEESREFDTFKATVLSVNFMDFYKLYNVDFNPSSKVSEDLSTRFDISAAFDTHLRVPVLVPDLPTTMRDPKHPGHERYCEFRLFTLMPHESTQSWDQFVADAKVRREQVEAKSAADAAAAHANDGPAPGGTFEDAYRKFRDEAKFSFDSRDGRLIKGDDIGYGGEIDVGNDDEAVVDSMPYGVPEDWMGAAGSTIKAIEELKFESDVDQSYWDTIASQYEHLALGEDWVAQMAQQGNIDEAAPEDPVDISSLNFEQQFLFSLLKEHHAKLLAAAREGTEPPPPLRVLVYGKGGTGKTHVLRAFREHVDSLAARDRDDRSDIDDDGLERKKCSLRFPSAWDQKEFDKFRSKHARDYTNVHKNQTPLTSKDIICAMAPSAQAAVAVGGDTIQGACAFPRSKGNTRFTVDQVDLKENSAALGSLQRNHDLYEYYFVDEMGMMGAEQLGVAEWRLRQAHSCTTGEGSFGGRSIICFGHHAQLPPVRDKRAFSNDKGLSSLQVAGITAYSESFNNVVILREQRRQRCDDCNGVKDSAEHQDKQRRLRHFRGLLDRIESCTVTEADWLFLKKHSAAIVASGGFDDNVVSRLCSRKEDKQKLNLDKLLEHSRATGNPIARIDAEHTGNSYARTVKASDCHGLEPHLYLSKGARVMSTSNGWKKAGLVNGAIGTVHEIIYDKGKGPPDMPVAILVSFPSSVFRGPSYLEDTPGPDGDLDPGRHRIVKFKPNTEYFTDPGTKGPDVVHCSRRQYPLELAYAMTIHKSQGQTLAKVCGNPGPSEFDAGLMYTLFSRVKDIMDIYLDPFPTWKRFSSWRDKLRERIAHESILENSSYCFIVNRVAAVRGQVPFPGSPLRRNHIDSLINGRLPCYLPRSWKQAQVGRGEKHYAGGGVISLPAALTSLVTHYRLRLAAAAEVAERKRKQIPGSRVFEWNSRAARRDWKPNKNTKTLSVSLLGRWRGAVKLAKQNAAEKKKASSAKILKEQAEARDLSNTMEVENQIKKDVEFVEVLGGVKENQDGDAEKAKAKFAAEEPIFRAALFQRNLEKIVLEYQIPLPACYQNAATDAAVAAAAGSLTFEPLKNVRMRFRLNDYWKHYGFPRLEEQWRVFKAWLELLGFEVYIDTSATQHSMACGMIAARCLSWFKHGRPGDPNNGDFMLMNHVGAANLDVVRAANAKLKENPLLSPRAELGSTNTWMLFGDEVRRLLDWWNQSFEMEADAQNLVQASTSWETRLDDFTQEQLGLLNTWWHNDKISEIFITGGDQVPSAFAFISVPYDDLCHRIAQDVHTVANGGPSVKRFIIANTEDSRVSGTHWVAVVYEIEHVEEGPERNSRATSLTTQVGSLLGVPQQRGSSLSTSLSESSIASSMNHQCSSDGVIGAEDPPASSWLWKLAACTCTLLLSSYSSIALTMGISVYNLAREFNKVVYYGRVVEDHRNFYAAQRALDNQREFCPWC
jgi:hypothetical protein